MSSTSTFNDIQFPSDINKKDFKKHLLNNSNENKNFKIKINQKFKNNNKKANTKIINKKIKNIYIINNHKKQNLIKLNKIKVINRNNPIINEGLILNSYSNIYNNPNHINNIYNDVGLYSEENNNSKNEYYQCLSKRSVDNKENIINIKRSKNKKLKNKTVKNSIDDIGKKLLIIVNDFHNNYNSNYLEDKIYNIHSGKLIDRIRTFRKLNNI